MRGNCDVWSDLLICTTDGQTSSPAAKQSIKADQSIISFYTRQLFATKKIIINTVTQINV